jgi:hypothetical protein
MAPLFSAAALSFSPLESSAEAKVGQLRVKQQLQILGQ